MNVLGDVAAQIHTFSTATCYEQLVLVLLEQLVASHNNLQQAVRAHPDIDLTTTLLQLDCRSVTQSL